MLATRIAIELATLQHKVRKIQEVAKDISPSQSHPWCDEAAHDKALTMLDELVEMFPEEVEQ